MVPGAEIAQYGIGIFALAVLAYALIQTQRNRRNHNDGVERIVAVVENNTRALENNTRALEQLLIIATRQETKLDELLVRARGE